MLVLTPLSSSDEAEFIQFSERYKAECAGEAVPFSLNPNALPFAEHFKRLDSFSRRETLPEGCVLTKYYLVRFDGQIIGAANIRCEDSDFILNYAGHIGYCIAPWERRKGYASAVLGMLLPMAESFGLSRVLLTCDHSNEGSRRVILKNGGIFEKRTEEKDIYCIEL